VEREIHLAPLTVPMNDLKFAFRQLLKNPGRQK
jgi:hypothetical protein